MENLSRVQIRETLMRQICEKNKSVSIDELEHINLYELNIDSLSIMRILSFWMKHGYKVNFAQFMKQPYVEQWADLIYHAEQKRETVKRTERISDREPFDLTDVQYAYWIGRKESQYLGGVGCHGYVEVRCKALDPKRLQEAWNVVQYSHPMLRACYTDDGKQYVMERPYTHELTIEDISFLSETKQHERLLQKREELSHRLLKIDEGQVAQLQLTKCGDDDYMLHFDIDLLICDVLSFKIILRDVARYYQTGQKPAVSADWNFSQYLHDEKEKTQKERTHAEQFWLQKILELPDGPHLPLRAGVEGIKYPRFCRRSSHFDGNAWERIQAEGTVNQLTPAMVLLTAYARSIARFSENKKFLLNLPIFNRNSEPGITEVVADFTNIVLVEVDFTESRSFLEDAKSIQLQFLENASNTACSGIWVMRELQKQQGRNLKAPVVFSCNLGDPLLSEEFVDTFGDLNYMISQTPQVWIDFQAFNENNGLTVLWDAIDEIFPEGLLDEMFGCFFNELQQVVEYGIQGNIVVCSEGEQRRREALEEQQGVQAFPKTLHEAIYEQAKVRPQAIALKNADLGITLTYEELTSAALHIAAGLHSKGMQDLVAIFLPRGEKQVIAALGILSAGMGYIPIHTNQPQERLQKMMNNPRIAGVITETEYADCLQGMSIPILDYQTLMHGKALATPVDAEGTDTAYIIYTSGTTGAPKGVEIAHQAVVNTIDEINSICAVGCYDVVLNVSSYDFDLSVYDFWGTLRAGGTLLVVDQKSWRNAKRWAELVEAEKVSIWNSVPTLFKMLLMEVEEGDYRVDSLRYVMLSGDWIDINIPKRICDLSASTHVLAMGGATEASIWSNYIDIQGAVSSDWISIPYGKPLPRQSYRVVNESGIDCPDYVVGELWIGGVGVAKGYLGDEELTRDKFVTDAYGRWYRTGDLGRFWKDDTIEFLGRSDRQVKLRGHRIELGEIENAIDCLPEVEKSYIDISKEEGTQALTAYVLLDKHATNDVIEHQVSGLDSISEQLTDCIFSVSKERAQKIYKQRAEYNAYCKEKVQELLKIAWNTEVVDSYRPLISIWETMATAEGVTSSGENATLDAFVTPFLSHLPKLLEGSEEAKDLVMDSKFQEVDKVLTLDYQSESIRDLLLEQLRQIRKVTNQTLCVLEYGTGNEEKTSLYRAALEPVDYTVSVFDPDVYELTLEDGYDLILCDQTLHRAKNIEKALANLQSRLKKGGLLCFAESTEMTSLAYITTIFLRKEYTDIRANSLNMLVSHDTWHDLCKESGFRMVWEWQDDGRLSGVSAFCLQNEQTHLAVSNSEWIKVAIRRSLPDYMIPKYVTYIKMLPMTKNGKVDRKYLIEKTMKRKNDEYIANCNETKTEKALANIWNSLLKTMPTLTDQFFVLGGDSLLATALRNMIKQQFQVEFSLEDIFLKPVLYQMAEAIDGLTRVANETRDEFIVFRDEHPYEPFPLTQMQQSYLIGRSGTFDLGSVSSHCYFEMDTEWLEEGRLQDAWNVLIRMHPMMRAVICDDHLTQKVLEQVPEYVIATVDASHLDKLVLETELREIRKTLSHQKFDPYQWPTYDIRYVKMPKNKARLFISFDNIFFDGWSMFYIFRQWKQLYDAPGTQLEMADITFKEYVNSFQANLQSEAYEKDVRYWQEKIPNMYPAPELPVTKDIKEEKFVRFQTMLAPDRWEILKQKIKQRNLTEPGFLMSLYAEVIARYSRHQKFSLNLTRFNRIPFTEKINQVVGDFTTLTILSLDFTQGHTFYDRATNLQKTLWKDLSHSNVSGVEVERMMNQNRESQITMPVVFTSGIGLTKDRASEDNSYLGTLGYGLSQTPQVWMDMQIYDDQTGLVVSLDAVENIFPEGMVSELFEAYKTLLEKFATTDEYWEQECMNLVVCKNRALVETLNDTKQEMPNRTLLSGIREQTQIQPDHVAVICGNRSYTYRELLEKAKNVALELLTRGLQRQMPVAICMKKSVDQVVAALGILLAGGIYLPLNSNHPFARNKKILNLAMACMILTDTEKDMSEYQEEFVCINLTTIEGRVGELPTEEADDLAYIIYTSGTTGEPKGVAITHRGAMNTILDVNARIHAGSSDATIALSQMNFDLSVYDVFGMLDVGGIIVIPEDDKTIEPSYWQELIQIHKITIWNSVPTYFQMFLAHLENRGNHVPEIQHVLLSGDWIAVDVGARAKDALPQARLYGLGGATEASIWSNWYAISEADKHRTSIPYGKPLANQSMYILNDVLDVVPNLVPGDLYIGGDGLAKCYWCDEIKTAQSYIMHSTLKIRLYKTGDLAKYAPEGQIIFLGREDGQIKLGGYRIELGEIESAIPRVSGNSDCAVIFADQQLHAFVCGVESNQEDFKEALKTYLPDYMIPKYIHFVSEIPLSANGKVDRNQLLRMYQRKEAAVSHQTVQTEMEKALAGIWSCCLKLLNVYADDNFFQLGGDSLKAVLVANEIKKELHLEIDLGTIFANPTIAQLACVIDEKTMGLEEGEI